MVALFLSAVPRATADDALVPQSSMQRILAQGELRVAVPRFDSPPFYVTSDGELSGYDIDLAKSIAGILGVKATFVRNAGTFDEVVQTIARGDADVAICKLSRTLARARLVQFSDPYVLLKHALIVNRMRFAELVGGQDAAAYIKTFDGTLGVIANSSFAGFAKENFPNADIRRFARWEDVVAAVQSGEIVAAYRDEFEIKQLMLGDPSLSLTLRTITLEDLTDTIGMATAAGDTHFMSFLNMYIATNVGLKSAANMLALMGEVQKSSGH